MTTTSIKINPLPADYFAHHFVLYVKEGGEIKNFGKFATVKDAKSAAWAMMLESYLVVDCGAVICGVHKGEIEHGLTLGDLEEGIFGERTK